MSSDIKLELGDCLEVLSDNSVDDNHIQTRHAPITLICDHCGKEFQRRYSYHKFLVEKRGIVKTYCSRSCKNIDQLAKLPNDLVARYENGESTCDIAATCNCSWSTVRRSLVKQGVKLRSRAWHMNTDKNPTKGKGHSDAAKKKISDAAIKQFSNPEARLRQAEITAKQIADGRTGKAFNKFESKIAARYTETGTVFVWQYPLGRYVYDFYLPDTNTIVEAHGTFWHADPRVYAGKQLSPIQLHNIANDINKANFAREQGYNFEIIWEQDV